MAPRSVWACIGQACGKRWMYLYFGTHANWSTDTPADNRIHRMGRFGKHVSISIATKFAAYICGLCPLSVCPLVHPLTGIRADHTCPKLQVHPKR